MGTQESPILKIMRLLEPNLDTNTSNLLDVSDCVDAINKSSIEFKKSLNHFPILRIPSYSNDVLLGESLQIAFILGNNTKTKFSNVFLKVEMVMEHEDTVETSSIFDGFELEPNCKPLEYHYSYLFEVVTRYRMTCSVQYDSPKGPLILKKMFMWNCINPVQLTHSLVKFPDGLNNLETKVKNKSKTLLVLKEVKLENRGDSTTYSPFFKYTKDNICLLRPEETLSILFTNVSVNYRTPLNTTNSGYTTDTNPNSNQDSLVNNKDNNNNSTNTSSNNKDNNDTSTTKEEPVNLDPDYFTKNNPPPPPDDYYLTINWHSYTNISGTNVSKVDSFSTTSELFYKVVDFPKNVKVNAPFVVNLFLQNLTTRPLDVSIKFKHNNVFILKNEKLETISLQDSQHVSLSLIALSTGLHQLDSIELHCNDKTYTLENLQILVL